MRFGLRLLLNDLHCSRALRASTLDNTPVALPTGRVKGKVLQVYDGDTLWIALPLGQEVYRYRARMYGYNAPELKPHLDVEGREHEIELAICAKKHLQELVGSALLDVECLGTEKYGRLLVKLYDAQGECINDQMIQAKQGVLYSRKL